MKSSRHAFTLVELLVVIAIIGILIGMMFPAVGAMHEAARRATCQGRMARIGLALQKHEAAHGALPAGTTDPKGPIHNIPQGIQMSWTVHLLPYLDEATTLKYIDPAAGAYARKNALARNVVIPAFVCPSQVAVANVAAPASSYAGCHNDVEQPINDDNHGVLFLNSRISERDVTDGVEHTIYVGEKLVDDGDLGWMSGSRATLRNAGTPIGETSNEPPSSDLYVGGFGSNHPSGAGFLFGDRAVKFLNRDIDTNILQQLAHRADGQLLTGGPTREDAQAPNSAVLKAASRDAAKSAEPAEQAAGGQQMLKLPVRVVDVDGKPVASARITPWALRSSQGHGWWKDDDKGAGVGPKEVITSEDGNATVLYPRYRNVQEQIRTLSVSLNVDHPEFAYVDDLCRWSPRGLTRSSCRPECLLKFTRLLTAKR